MKDAALIFSGGERELKAKLEKYLFREEFTETYHEFTHCSASGF